RWDVKNIPAPPSPRPEHRGTLPMIATPAPAQWGLRGAGACRIVEDLGLMKQAQVLERSPGHLAAAGCAHHVPRLEQEGLDHLRQGGGLLIQGGGDRFDSDRTAPV